MFPFCCNPYADSQTKTRENHRKHQLEFLKTIHDHLEASLAAVSAAIRTIEAQEDLINPQESDAV